MAVRNYRLRQLPVDPRKTGQDGQAGGIDIDRTRQILARLSGQVIGNIHEEIVAHHFWTRGIDRQGRGLRGLAPATGLWTRAGLRQRLALVLNLGHFQKVRQVFQAILTAIRDNGLGNIRGRPAVDYGWRFPASVFIYFLVNPHDDW